MAKYSDIKGFTVQTLSTDPIESTPPTGSWSSGGTMNDGKPYGFKGGGVQTAAISFGAATSNDTANENYNGTSWTENSAMSDGFSYGTGTGSQTDAIAIGGVVNPGLNMKNQTEEWNGSSWTAGGNINTARYNVNNQAWGPGTLSSFAGGNGPDYQPKSFHEQYNGSAWTETTDLPTDIFSGSASGTQTNAILASGNHTKTPPGSSTFDGKTITWNGSAWTEITEFSTARSTASGSGVYNDFILVGGYAPSPGNLALTEKWNGSSWTEIADISTARNSMGVSKTESDSTSAIIFGGSPSPTITEEFSVAPPTASIITEGQLFYNSTTNVFKETIIDIPGATWASSGSMNTARGYGAGAGTQTAAFIATGGVGPATSGTNAHEQYNGSSWTETTEVNTSRSYAGGFGTPAAGIVCGGYNPPGTLAITELWNGSAWTEVNDMNTATQRGALGGTSTAGFSAGGYTPSATDDKMETWDGTSWTETTDMGTARFYGAASSNAPYTATIVFGGSSDDSPFTLTGNAEKWDGSAWTEVGNLNDDRDTLGGAGATQDNALAFAGFAPGNSTKTEFWNGTSWTEVNDVSTGRTVVGNAGTASGALLCGGFAPSATGATEEFTASLSNKTITST